MKHFIIVLVIGLVLGFLLGKKTNKEVVITTTEIVYDSIPYYIKIPTIHTITKVEKEILEIKVPEDVDSLGIVLDYFTRYVNVREWENEDIKILITDTISKNALESGDLQYTIFKPTTINNTYVYSFPKYLTAELLVPISVPNNYGIKLSYVNRKTLFSIGYRPEMRSLELGFGFTLKHW